MAKQRGGGVRTYLMYLTAALIVVGVILAVLGGLGYFKKGGVSSSGSSGTFSGSTSGSIDTHNSSGLSPGKCINNLMGMDGANSTHGGQISGSVSFNWSPACGHFSGTPSELWGQIGLKYQEGHIVAPMTFTSVRQGGGNNWYADYTAQSSQLGILPTGMHFGFMNITVGGNTTNVIVSNDIAVFLA